jgi:hypothetical protein
MNRNVTFSSKSPDCLPDDSGGHIMIDRTLARLVGQSPTATNAHDLVTSKRGGPGPYRAVEPRIIIINGTLLFDNRIGPRLQACF